MSDLLVYESPALCVCLRNLGGEVLIDISRPVDDFDRPVRATEGYLGGRGWHRIDDESDQIERLPGEEAVFWSWRWRLGIAYGLRWHGYHHAVLFPHWIDAVLAAVLPVGWSLRRPRARRGHCESCGYNLTANASGVCPECGSATTARVKA